MRRLFWLILSSLLLLFFSVPAFAQQPNSIPERNGDYPDPEHPGVRVRVFVHEPKPSPSSSPVLSCNDPDSSAVVPPTVWHLPSSVTYHLNTSSAPSSIGAASFSSLAGNAYNSWQNAVSGKVTFSKGTDTTVNRNALDFQNIVAWGRTLGTALAVTYTRYYTATHEVADVDTIMNVKFPWNWTDPSLNQCSLYSNSYDAQDILTHETGHWMGLDDTYSSQYVDNTMYGYGAKGEVKKDTLTSGDINGVKAIY